MIVIGLLGIWKYKLPKFRPSPGYASKMRLYFTFYVLVILGCIFLLIEFFGEN